MNNKMKRCKTCHQVLNLASRAARSKWERMTPEARKAHSEMMNRAKSAKTRINKGLNQLSTES